MVSWLITSLRCRGRGILPPPFAPLFSHNRSSWALFPPHECTPWLTPLQEGKGGLGSREVGCCDRRVHKPASACEHSVSLSPPSERSYPRFESQTCYHR